MAKKVYIDFELKYKEAVKNLDEMQKEYSKLEKQVDKTSDSQKELGNILDTTTGGAVTKFKSLKSTLGTVVKGFKSLRVAILATGIGALVLAVGSLATMFTNSEEGQNKFRKILTQIGVVAGNVTDILSDLGKVVFNVFTGNFKAAGEALNDVTDGIKNFGEETRKELAVAGELADKRAEADIRERKLLLERAEADRKVAELREKAADKENVSVEERIKAIKEAGRIAEEITKKEIAAARLRFEAKRDENALSESTKEDLDEQAQLQARLIELETARLLKQKALTAEITTALREEQAERNAIESERKAKEKEFAEDTMFLPGVGFVSRETFNTLKAKQDEQRKAKAEADKKDIEDRKNLLEKEKQIELAKRQMREQTFNNAVQLAGAESRLGRTILLAKQVLLAKEAIMNFKSQVIKATAAMGNVSLTAAEAGVQTTASIAKAANVAPPPFNLPFIATALSTAISVMSAVKAAKGKTKQVASTIGGAGGIDVNVPSPSISTPAEVESMIPQFDTVGASGTNQLASALGGQAPLRAFVVSGDVSTAQEMDRNIVTSASLG